VVTLIGNITEDTDDDLCPLLDKKPDYLTRIYNGSKLIPRTDATFINGHLDKGKFEAYISVFSDDAIEGLRSALTQKGIKIDNKYQVAAVCADILADILIERVNDGKLDKSKNKLGIANELMLSQEKFHLPQVPLATVYVKDGKIHIGDNIIKLPKKLVPPGDIKPHEQIYITELLGALDKSHPYNSHRNTE
jgi:hypothetical protein